MPATRHTAQVTSISWIPSEAVEGMSRLTFDKVAQDTELLRQGDEGDELYLLLDGAISVTVDGTLLAELGPGAVFGERAGLSGGRRTATVIAPTPCRVASTQAAALPIEAFTALADEHRREDPGPRRSAT